MRKTDAITDFFARYPPNVAEVAGSVRDVVRAAIPDVTETLERRAAEHFDQSVALYEIEDAITFVLEETRRLAAAYPAVLVAPLLYRVEDDRLLQIVRS